MTARRTSGQRDRATAAAVCSTRSQAHIATTARGATHSSADSQHGITADGNIPSCATTSTDAGAYLHFAAATTCSTAVPTSYVHTTSFRVANDHLTTD